MHRLFISRAVFVCLLLYAASISWLSTSMVPFTQASNSAPAFPDEPAAGMFLVAQRGQRDGLFSQSVVYLLQHGRLGSLGVIVNRPSPLNLSDAVTDINDKSVLSYPLYYGGPVEIAVVIMLICNTDETRLITHVADNIYVSADRQVLEQLLAEKKPENELHFYLGHAGWIEGQLMDELAREDWHLMEGDADAIFSTNPDTLWQRLIEQFEPSGIYAESGRHETVLSKQKS